MKRSIALILGILLLSGLLAGCTSGYQYDNAEQYTAGNSEANAADVQSIDIDWIAGSVTVKAYDGETVKFADNSPYPSQPYLLHSYVDDGTLRIRFYESGRRGMDTGVEKDLEVLIPTQLAVSLETVVIGTVSADIYVHDIACDVMDAETVSGEVMIAGSIQNLLAESTSGNLSLSGTFAKLDVETVSGNVAAICTQCPDTMTGESTSGSFRMVIPADSNFSCEFDTVSGKLSGDFGTLDSDGVLRIPNETADMIATLSFETVSGDVLLSKNG